METNKEFWEGKNVLVTGGCGFIGHHLVMKLLKETNVGYVLVADDLSRGEHGWNVMKSNKFRLVSDHRDYKRFGWNDFFEESWVSGFQADVVIHLAAMVGGYSFYVRNQDKVAVTNTLCDMQVVENSIKYKVPYFFFASSYHVYGQDSLNSSEPQAINKSVKDFDLSYSFSKMCTERVLQWNRNNFRGLSIARLNGIYGPGQDISLGNASFIPAFCHRVCTYPQNEAKINTDGSELGTFCFIDDAVLAILRMIENSEEFDENTCVKNVGDEEQYSILDIAKKIVNISKKDVDIEVSDCKANLQIQYCDIDDIKNSLGWEPFTSIDEGLAKTYRDIEQRLKISEET